MTEDKPKRGVATKTVEPTLRLMAGCVVLLSVVLVVFHSSWWLILTAFVALNLIQSAFTDTCPAVWFLERFGFKRCQAPE